MKKKGFTLIELLAVIVILAVIALIATPLIMNVINDAKKNSFKDSAYGIIKAVEIRVASEQINNTDGPNVAYKLKVGKENPGISYSGELPDEGWAYVDVNGKVQLYVETGDFKAYYDENTSNQVQLVDADDTTFNAIKGKFNESTGDYKNVKKLTLNGSEGGSGGEASVSKKMNEIAITNSSLGVTAISDCIEVGNICATGTPFVVKVNDSTSYKFYVISDDGSYVDLIMSDNLGSYIPWINQTDYENAGGLQWVVDPNDSTETITDDGTSFGPLTALNYLENQTSTWTNITPYNYDLSNDGIYSIRRTNARARMITEEEITGLIVANDYDPPIFIASGDHHYWTSNAHPDYASCGLWVSEYGYPDSIGNISSPNYAGVRPIIHVAK